MDDARHALARDALQQGRFAEAEELFAAIVSENPHDTEALYFCLLYTSDAADE